MSPEPNGIVWGAEPWSRSFEEKSHPHKGVNEETFMKRLFVFLTVLITAIVSAACSGAQTLSAENPWARPALSGDNSAVYFEVINPSGEEDFLIGTSSEVASQVEIHESEMDASGTMSMHPQHSVSIPAQGRVEFKPGGLHVMLVAVHRDLRVGDTFLVTLSFENSADQTIEVEVKQP